MREPKTTEQALAYMTDCTLATVASMALKKRRPVGEYHRQIQIAQHGCDWMEVFKVPAKGTRAEDIIWKTTVARWAAQYESI